MTGTSSDIRLGADIGGTFTDIALDRRRRDLLDQGSDQLCCARSKRSSTGSQIVGRDAGIRHADIGIVIHGTTLATNALIARRGAKTALVTTEGFRDVIEMRTENRFEQYDLNLRLPPPLIPREHRFSVKGRIGAEGQELQPLDEDALERIRRRIRDGGFERRGDRLHPRLRQSGARAPRAAKSCRGGCMSRSRSASEVSPQMREFERFNTVCANAYVTPADGGLSRPPAASAPRHGR